MSGGSNARGLGPWVVTAGLALTAAILLGEAGGLLPRPEGPPPDLTRARRVEVTAPGAFENLLLGLRVHHYRPQPQSEALYRDLYFDTDAGDLLRHGYSYRFRTRLEGGGGAKYSLHLEQESRFVPPGARRTELTTDLPDSDGEAIAADHSRALDAGAGIEACERLLAVLEDLGIARSRLGPRLVGELRRERLDVSDKGQNWFQMDHERWTFHGVEDTSRIVRIEDVALDVRLSPRDRELVRRVRTLDGLLPLIHGVRPAREAPYERALAALAASS